MHNFFIKTVTLINTINETIFSPVDKIIEQLPFKDWAIDAIIDSVHMIPFLLFIFILIELFEYKYADKMKKFAEHSNKIGPIAGSLAASFPQCGFSIMASTLYTQKLITKGTLLAVFISTSDEAIPVILSEPTKMKLVVPLILTKIIIAIVAGYLIDLLFKDKQTNRTDYKQNIEEPQEGCCHHHINQKRKTDLVFHPIFHTLNISVFILVITLCINFIVFKLGGEENIGQFFLHSSIMQPVITAILGLIPNCAASVAITLMYMKGLIGFGAVISGLCSSAGLGLLILFKKNESIKDTLKIIILLLFISIISGIILQLSSNWAIK